MKCNNDTIFSRVVRSLRFAIMNGFAGCKVGLLVAGMGVLAATGAIPAMGQVGQGEADSARLKQAPASRAANRSPDQERQFRRALMAWRTGASLLEAKARLDHLLRELPDDVEARKLRAEVLLEMGRPEEALRDATRVVELRPQDGEGHLLHAEAAREDSRLEAARAALDRAAEHLPKQARLHTRFSWNAMLLDRLAQAEAFGRVALALDSTSAPAYRQLARVFLQRERPDEAAAVLARGLRAEVLQPRALHEDELLRSLTDHARLVDLLRR